MDIGAVIDRDPAVRGYAEVWLAYPGFHAVIFYRFAHKLWILKLHLISKLFSQFSRFITGVEIHPAAKIGAGFFIDHGAGVVIGETSEIGENVTIYHGVTLGGIAPAIDSARQANTKRHPTIEDGVIIGAGSQILGPISLGKNSRVGANAVVLRDVPSGATVIGNPGRIARAPRVVDPKFEAYGASGADVNDPFLRTLESLVEKTETLQARISALEELHNRDNGELSPQWAKNPDVELKATEPREQKE